MVAIHPLVVVGIGYTAGVLFFFARGLKPGARRVAFVLLAAVVLGSAMGLEARSWPVRYVVVGMVLIIFLLHGLAAVLTHRFKPTGWLVVPATLFTFAFNTASTILLFIPINDRIPFYVNDVPGWMYLW